MPGRSLGWQFEVMRCECSGSMKPPAQTHRCPGYERAQRCLGPVCERPPVCQKMLLAPREAQALLSGGAPVDGPVHRLPPTLRARKLWRVADVG